MKPINPKVLDILVRYQELYSDYCQNEKIISKEFNRFTRLHKTSKQTQESNDNELALSALIKSFSSISVIGIIPEIDQP
jgi:alpha-N-acetylglucosamine transferase